ncbi:MAG: GNAT family N-acetyltransferase [Candidatus Heimdallarchaeota archaeon]|nr:GNAT family N-acetyltransferase [Candidatus Heimdallarchaeota archaeon]
MAFILIISANSFLHAVKIVTCMRFSPFPNLETSRLVLRKLEKKDATAIFEYQRDKSNFPHVDMEVYTTITQAYDYILNMNDGIESNSWIIWAICNKSDDIMGTISIWNFDKKKNKAELGYGLFPSYRGKGYMSEVLEQVTKFGFDQLALTSIEAYTNENNKASRKLLENQDFVKIGSIEENDARMVIYSKSNS